MNGKCAKCAVGDRTLLIFNQRSAQWIYPYPHATDPDDTLHSAGCGIFSICHAAEFLTGRRFDPEALADFSLKNGGRDETGTDRPSLLAALQRAGEAEKMGFRYDFDGLRNDLDALWSLLSSGGGAALCNLRAGHIVCLVGAEERGGEKCVLAIDSHPAEGSSPVSFAPLSGVRDFNLLHRVP